MAFIIPDQRLFLGCISGRKVYCSPKVVYRPPKVCIAHQSDTPPLAIGVPTARPPPPQKYPILDLQGQMWPMLKKAAAGPEIRAQRAQLGFAL